MSVVTTTKTHLGAVDLAQAFLPPNEIINTIERIGYEKVSFYSQDNTNPMKFFGLTCITTRL